MVMNPNCQCFKANTGECLHAAAPRPWFGRPQCVLIFPPDDPRWRGCALRYPHLKPDGYPLPPPSVLRRDGSLVATRMPPNV